MDHTGTGRFFRQLPELDAPAPPGFALPTRPRVENSGEHFDRSVDQFGGPQGGGGGGPDIKLPFDAVFGSGTVSFRPGTLNSILPSNYLASFAVTPGVTYYAKIVASALDGQITSCSLEFNTTPPTGIGVLMGQPPTTFRYLLGIVIDSSWFRTAPQSSLSAQSKLSFTVSKTDPDPGTLPYDSYWTWIVSAG